MDILKNMFKRRNRYDVSYTLIVRSTSYDSVANIKSELITTKNRVILAHSSKEARSKIRRKKGYDVRNIQITLIKSKK